MMHKTRIIHMLLIYPQGGLKSLIITVKKTAIGFPREIGNYASGGGPA